MSWKETAWAANGVAAEDESGILGSDWIEGTSLINLLEGLSTVKYREASCGIKWPRRLLEVADRRRTTSIGASCRMTALVPEAQIANTRT